MVNLPKRIQGEKRPELIIADIIIPGMNGIDLIKKIRETDNKTPILVMSGFEDELKWAKRAGVSGVILKPPKIDELLEMISEIENESKQAA